MARQPKTMQKDVVKPRKKRKPMTAEQKQAAGERLAKAREKRLLENPPQYKSIHPSVVERGEDDPLNMKNIQIWIKSQKNLLSAAKRSLRDKIKGAEGKVANHEAYIRNLQRFLKYGVYVDCMYGEFQESRVKYASIAMAYDSNGTPKRTIGVYYADLGYEWTGKFKEGDEGLNE